MNDPMDIDAPDPVTVAEAAKLVGRAKITVQKWIERGKLAPLAQDSRGFIVDRRDVFRVADDLRRGRACSK